MNAEARGVGYVIAVSGARITGVLEMDAASLADGYGATRDESAARIGALARMRTPDSTVFGIVSELHLEFGPGGLSNIGRRVASIDLIGEMMDEAPGQAGLRFQRGVSVFPTLGVAIELASEADIERVYARPSRSTVPIGTVHQNRDTPAYLVIDDLLGKHFAVLGTTGSGKSCTVALILRKVLEAHRAGRVVLLDPHAEYVAAFGDMAESIDMSTLQLPCWLFNFEETVAVLLGDADMGDRAAQVAILKDAILQARKRFLGDKEDTAYVTVDTPIPYRLGEVVRIVDTAMGKLDNPDKITTYLRLKSRLESLSNDKRYAFMFAGVVVRDTMAQILSRLLRLPVAGKPLTIVDLSGVPSEVVDVVVSVLCRMIFDFALWSERNKGQPILLVCEEAHRYIPSDERTGFSATKLALARIAKEGRKYGVSLCLVSQRPSELSTSVLSQCGTIFALRMGNEQDQSYVGRALPENAQSLLGVLPALRQQEAIAVGEGVTVPMRVRFADLPEEQRPRSASAAFSTLWQDDKAKLDFVEDTVRRWRQQIR